MDSMQDSSIEDVADSLAGLAKQPMALLPAQGYERLVTRWRSVQAFESSI
jgi:hypothetical protein